MNKKLVAAFIFSASVLAGADAYAKSAQRVAVDLAVTESGFEPKSIDVKPGSDVVLNVTRKTDTTCAKQIQVPSKNVKVDLPLNKPVTVALGKLEKGEIKFGCGMSMMEGGKILVK
ncbi:MAG: cupredoxin domain-containing protein [Bdellovibrionales bacterium]